MAIEEKKVLLLIDWENLFLNLFDVFREKMQLSYRIEDSMKWLKETGELLGGKGFVFAPEHLSYLHQEICVENNLQIMICPKKEKRDIVDETIIWFGRIMLSHPEVGILCLASGDDDFVPLLEDAQKNGIKTSLIIPTINSLSRNLLSFIEKDPKTGKRIALMMDNL